MKIGIIGAGNIGYTMAALLTKAGHEIAISNSRGPDSLNDLIDELGPSAHAETVDNAAAFGEVVLLAVPWRSPEALPHPDLVANKVVIDAMNPYSADSQIIDLGLSTSSEETARRLPDARIVKAFNTIWFKTLAQESDPYKEDDAKLAIFIAGDEPGAKQTVSELIRDIGFAPIDAGTLQEGGRKLQPGTSLYGKPFTQTEAQEALQKA